MPESDRHGSLLINEMKLCPTLVFDWSSLEVHGFTDLGKYTPVHQSSEKGDHALVLMFQPFKGKWVQAIACFLSKGAASGTVLHHLIIECVLLLEQSGFFVDVVVTDGATWNRKMWEKFGINLNNISCEHVYDPSRRLWFVLDFPHLIKNFRNSIVKNKMTLTPDGPVNLKFWDAVAESDKSNSFNLKVCPKLTPDHIRPKFYQKMNVGMAFQFFSDSVAAAMTVYKDSNPSLEGCEGCIVFIKRINKLIDNMNSRTPLAALKLSSSSQSDIQDFINYLKDWENFCKETNSHFLTNSTYYGLLITLQATLEIAEFLITKCSYSYLMTARLNHDSLERFFGIMRHACGSNDHPNSFLFLQVFRLVGIYSLIKPPVNSNVEGTEMIQTLLEFDFTDSSVTNKSNFKEKLDSIIENGTSLFKMSTAVENCSDHNYHSLNSTRDN